MFAKDLLTLVGFFWSSSLLEMAKELQKAFLEDIASQESEAERSLMHRYSIIVNFV